jgi:GT2 family glycosyltransferase/SAM-dependent methyltransferase
MSGRAPIRIVHLDLREPVPPLEIRDGDRGLKVVFWWGPIPLGHADLPAEAPAIPAARVARLAAVAVAPAVAAHVLPHTRAPLPDVASAPTAPGLYEVRAMQRPLSRIPAPARSRIGSISVIVCTRERPEALARCLAALGALRRPPDELVVVDNAPGSDATRRLVAGVAGVRYVAEPRPGLSRARNAGLRAARGELIAFTDDDVVVHPEWLGALEQAFVVPEVMAATGLVLPLALDTEAQVIFEHGLGFGQGYRRLDFDRAFFETMKPYGVPAWRVGAGASMAFRREAFERVGEFHEALGAGAAGCSEDSELWYRILAAGGTCRYEPTAVVFHEHRRERAELARQVRHYLRGHVAALAVQFAQHRHRGNLRRLALALPKHYTVRAARALRGRADAGAETLRDEVMGWIAGLVFLFRRPGLEAARAAVRRRRPPAAKAPLGAFLAANPFPAPLTEGFFYREKMRAIHRLTPDRPVREVLEVGGGQSGLTRLLFPRARITNLDANAAYANAPCNRQAGVGFVCADATRLPFPDAAFDVVTMFDVLEHVPDDRGAAAEALRVVRPGGVLLVSAPNERWRFPYYAALRRVCPTDVEMMAEWGHVRRGYSLADLAALFGQPPREHATFTTPLTVLAHDIAFSRLPARVKRWALRAIAPLTWTAYALHRPHGPGTETVSVWEKVEPGAIGRTRGGRTPMAA